MWVQLVITGLIVMLLLLVRQRWKVSAEWLRMESELSEEEYEIWIAAKLRDAEAWSCTPAERDVLVIPDEAIHVELVWDTPGDDDPTDEGYEVGSDLDLHFVHKENAEAMPPSQGVDLYPPEYPPALVPVGDGLSEGYFDDIWDTFWFYTSK